MNKLAPKNRGVRDERDVRVVFVLKRIVWEHLTISPTGLLQLIMDLSYTGPNCQEHRSESDTVDSLSIAYLGTLLSIYIKIG